MTAPRTGLDGVVVVLYQPQNLINVAAVIRAMKNMGLSRLRCVQPAEWDPWRIEGIAHRSHDIVASTEMFESLEEAVGDCVRVVAASGRSRMGNRNYTRPHEVAPRLLRATEDGPVALVFGREDQGLANEQLDLCDAVAVIPTSPSYTSLNLAQAFLVFAYELFRAAQASGVTEAEAFPVGRRPSEAATREDLERAFGALEEAMHRIRFFKGTRSPESVLRTLRTVLARTELDRREANLFAALGFETRHFVDRLEAASRDEETKESAPG